MTTISHWFKRHATLLKIIFFGIVLFFVANQVKNIAHGMSWQTVWLTIKQQNQFALLSMLGVGLCGVLPMLLYDHVAITTLEAAGRPRMNRKEWLVWGTMTSKRYLIMVAS